MKRLFAFAIATAFAPAALAFDSGSTGADGPFNPAANVTVQLPPTGIFNYTTVNIPAGVTVKFQRNATNTPVVILASGDVVIAGSIDLSGSPGFDNTLFGNDAQPGAGGPGGFEGGAGGQVSGDRRGSYGLGPGGGGPGTGMVSGLPGRGTAGGGAGFSTAGLDGMGGGGALGGSGGVVSGSAFLQPLTGGSGGGGGGGGLGLRGMGGGGGGGAILIASSGNLDLLSTGSVLANGARGGVLAVSVGDSSGCGGGGSGGAIRLVATAVRGNGLLNAIGGDYGGPSCGTYGGAGGKGRVRIEGNLLTYANGANNPSPVVDLPSALSLPGQPALRIASVAGVAAPATPSGNMDVILPAGTANPVTVAFETTGVPVGSTINLSVIPPFAAPVTAQSAPTTGTTTLATAAATVSIPTGHSVFQASVSYTVVASLGDELSRFARNERVERVTLATTFGGTATARLTTVSGKEYEAPAEALRMAAAGK